MLKCIATGLSHSLVASNKQLYACGINNGELGLGHRGSSSYFMASSTLPSDKKIIAIGASSSCSFVDKHRCGATLEFIRLAMNSILSLLTIEESTIML